MHLQICLLELLRAKFSEILLGHDMMNLKRGAESHGCSDGSAVQTTLALQAFLSSTDPLTHLTLMAVWEYLPLQKPLKSSRKVLSLLLGNLTQPRAADFGRSMENTALQCTVRVAVGAGVLFPEALPGLKNWNVTNRPLLFFVRCWTTGCVYI